MNIKSLFIKEDDSKQEVNTPPIKNSSVQPTSMTIEVPKPEAGTSNVETEAKIWNMIIAKNLPGPDYLEFKNIIAGLADVIPDEIKQMQGAFNVLRKSYPAFNKDVIVSSIETYIGIVNEEKEKGIKQCAEQKASKIGSKQQEVKDLEASLAEVNAQIAELQKKQGSIAADITNLNSEIAIATKELDEQEQVFLHSIEAVTLKLQADKQKVINNI